MAYRSAQDIIDSFGSVATPRKRKRQTYTPEDITGSFQNLNTPQIQAVRQSFAKQLAAQRTQQPKQKQQQKQQIKQSAFDKIDNFLFHDKAEHAIGSFVKNMAVSTGHEAETLATPFARMLPGGTNDLKNEQRESNQAIKNITLARNIAKQRKSNADNLKRLIKENAIVANQTSHQTQQIVKKMPTRREVLGSAIGVGSFLLPGAGKGLEIGGRLVARDLAERLAARRLEGGIVGAGLRAGSSAVEQAPVGAAFSGGQAMSEGKGNKDVLKSALEGAAFTAGPAGTGSLLKSGVRGVTERALNPVRTAAVHSVLNNTRQSSKALSQQILEHHKPSSVPTELGQNAISYIKSHPHKVMNDYDNRSVKNFGSDNVVSTDEAKHILPGYKPETGDHYQGAGAAVARYKYDSLLKDETTKDKPVLITAGGSGAGKTSVLREAKNFHNYAAVVDTNLSSAKSAEEWVGQALKSGRKVEIVYTFRHPKDALRGVIKRTKKGDHIVNLDAFTDTHIGSHQTIKDLAKKYSDNPDVTIDAHLNTGKPGEAEPVSIDKIPKIEYNRDKALKAHRKEVENAHKQGKITEVQRQAFHYRKTHNHSRSDVAESTKEPRSGQRAGVRPESGGRSQARTSGRPEETSTPSKINNEPPPKTPLPKSKSKGFNSEVHESMAAEYHNPEDFAKDTAEHYFNIEKQAKGGQMVSDGEGGYKRITEHSKFYRDFYKANKRAPKLRDYQEAVDEDLKNGTHKVIQSTDEHAIHQLISDREAANAANAKEGEALVEDTRPPRLRPIGEGQTKTAKLAAGVEQKAVENKLAQNLGDLPEYQQVNMKDQAQKAIELLDKDKDQAVNIARGYEDAPNGLLPEAVFTAVEDRATRDGDWITLRQLAQSTRTTEATAMGQRIRALAERSVNSAVAAIQSVDKAKAAAVAKRLKTTANKAVGDEVKKIKGARKPITKSEWTQFVESIRC